jgi:hypothetical protein
MNRYFGFHMTTESDKLTQEMQMTPNSTGKSREYVSEQLSQSYDEEINVESNV